MFQQWNETKRFSGDPLDEEQKENVTKWNLLNFVWSWQEDFESTGCYKRCIQILSRIENSFPSKSMEHRIRINRELMQEIFHLSPSLSLNNECKSPFRVASNPFFSPSRRLSDSDETFAGIWKIYERQKRRRNHRALGIVPILLPWLEWPVAASWNFDNRSLLEENIKRQTRASAAGLFIFACYRPHLQDK